MWGRKIRKKTLTLWHNKNYALGVGNLDGDPYRIRSVRASLPER